MRSRQINRGDVFLCDLGESQGSIQGGTRPVVVVQNNQGNLHSSTCIVVPVTSKDKPKLRTHLYITLDVESTVLCEQLLTIMSAQLKNRIYRLTEAETQELDNALMVSLGIERDNEKDYPHRTEQT